MAEQKKINYKHHLSHEKWVAYYDPDKIEKILNNLLSNALKYTPGKGVVTTHIMIQENERSSLPATERTGVEYLVIRVNDTGPGIPADQQDKIFSRFHRVEDGTSHESPGTGIGLALVKELVELMHGRISVESEPEKGSTFIVYIPLDTGHLEEYEYSILGNGEEEKLQAASGDEIKEEPIEIVEEPGKEKYNETVDEGSPVLLIVEDNPDIRSHIHEYIRDEYQVLEEENGARGLETALEKIPDLIITDLMMPEMDGVELCEKLKTNELTSHIPVIMLTAKADISSKIEGLETGADDYITKPFNMKELSVRINNLIKSRKELREKFSRGFSLEPKEISVTSYDEKFLKRALEIVEEHIRDNDFDVVTFGSEIGMSRMQLFRKIKAMTDQSPTEFIRTIRLKRAAQLIRGNFGNLAEITYEVGFNHPSYFAKSFKELFGVSPSEYASNLPPD